MMIKTKLIILLIMYPYANLGSRVSGAVLVEGFVSGVYPKLVDSMDEAVTCAYRQVIRFMDMKV